jgi:hypothetical protein
MENIKHLPERTFILKIIADRPEGESRVGMKENQVNSLIEYEQGGPRPTDDDITQTTFKSYVTYFPFLALYLTSMCF